MNDLVRTADLRDKRFLKSDTTKWSQKLYRKTEIVNDTKPSYKINQLPKRYNEALLKKTELTLEENNSVMKTKKIKLTQIGDCHHWESIFFYLFIEEKIRLNLLLLERLV